jgi:GNAT superfamily N-acetyltransferase
MAILDVDRSLAYTPAHGEEKDMIAVRPYRESDAESVGILIADTFSEYNLSDMSPEQRDQLLGPFLHARSAGKSHRQAIAEATRAEIVLVAEDDGQVVGVLRGRADKLQSLFVHGDRHRQGIGRRLVERFERACVRQGATVIRVQATLYAVPFYLKMGYKRSTGVRCMRIFGGTGFRYQPMKKVL